MTDNESQIVRERLHKGSIDRVCDSIHVQFSERQIRETSWFSKYITACHFRNLLTKALYTFGINYFELVKCQNTEVRLVSFLSRVNAFAIHTASGRRI